MGGFSRKPGPIYTGVERGFLDGILVHVCLLGVRLLGICLGICLLGVHGSQDLLLARDLFRLRIGFIGGSVIRQWLFCCRACRCVCLLSLILIFPLGRVRL